MNKSLSNSISAPASAVSNTPVKGQSAVNAAEPFCNTLNGVCA